MSEHSMSELRELLAEHPDYHAAMRERAAVVRYLRETAKGFSSAANTLEWYVAADAIERGDHLKEPTT